MKANIQPVSELSFQLSEVSSEVLRPSGSLPQVSDLKKTLVKTMQDALEDLFCGTVSGMCGKIVDYPTDTIKVRLQAANGGLKPSALSPSYYRSSQTVWAPFSARPSFFTVLPHPPVFTGAPMACRRSLIASISPITISSSAASYSAAPPQVYTGALDCCLRIAKEEGVRGFYAGIPAPLAGVALSNAACFLFYGRAMAACEHMGWFHNVHATCHGSKPHKRPVSSDVPERSPLGAVLVSGAMAGIATATVLTPIELVKLRMQREQQLSMAANRPPRFNTTFQCIKHLLCSFSVPGSHRGIFQTVRSTICGAGVLFNGYSATLCREVPGLACWFGLYEFTLRTCFSPQVTPLPATSAIVAVNSMPWYSYPIAGSVAGLGYWSVLYPADTVKTRMQLDSAYQRLGLWQSLRRVYLLDNGGMRALYRGYGVTAVHAVMANATIFTTYEMVKKYIFPREKPIGLTNIPA